MTCVMTCAGKLCYPQTQARFSISQPLPVHAHEQVQLVCEEVHVCVWAWAEMACVGSLRNTHPKGFCKQKKNWIFFFFFWVAQVLVTRVMQPSSLYVLSWLHDWKFASTLTFGTEMKKENRERTPISFHSILYPGVSTTRWKFCCD